MHQSSHAQSDHWIDEPLVVPPLALFPLSPHESRYPRGPWLKRLRIGLSYFWMWLAAFVLWGIGDVIQDVVRRGRFDLNRVVYDFLLTPFIGRPLLAIGAVLLLLGLYLGSRWAKRDEQIEQQVLKWRAIDEPGVSLQHGVPRDILPRIRPFLHHRELETVMGVFRSAPWGKIIYIYGPMGSGCTSVAAEAIHAARNGKQFRDGIVVIDCQACETQADLLRAILAHFDQGRRTPLTRETTALIAETREALAGKRALLVLDDLSSRPVLLQVVQPLRASGVVILVTSTSAPPANWEHIATRVKIQPLDQAQTEVLCAGLLVDASPSRSLWRQIHTISRGNALAIRLEAGCYHVEQKRYRINTQESTHAAKIVQAGEPSEWLKHAVMHSVRSLANASGEPFEASNNLMNPQSDPYKLLQALMLLDTSEIGQQAVREVAGMLAIYDADVCIAELVKRGLMLQFEDTRMPERIADHVRLRIHPAIRHVLAEYFASLQSEQAPLSQRLSDAIRTRLARFYAEYVGQVSVAALPLYETLSPDAHNFANALSWVITPLREMPQQMWEDDPALRTCVEIAAALCSGMQVYWLRYGDISHLLEGFGWGMRLASQRVMQGRWVQDREMLLCAAGLIFSCGLAMYICGSRDVAEEQYMRSKQMYMLASSDRERDRDGNITDPRVLRGLAITDLGLGFVALDSNDLDRAKPHFEDAGNEANKVGAGWLARRAMAGLMEIEQRTKRRSSARRPFHSNVPIATGQRPQEPLAPGAEATWHNARRHWDEGKLDLAAEECLQAADMYHHNGRAHEGVAACMEFAEAARQSRNQTLADELFHKALEMADPNDSMLRAQLQIRLEEIEEAQHSSKTGVDAAQHTGEKKDLGSDRGRVFVFPKSTGDPGETRPMPAV